jgi:carboxyl-terminal processing protease
MSTESEQQNSVNPIENSLSNTDVTNDFIESKPKTKFTFKESLMRLGKNIYFTSSISLILGICIGAMSYVAAAKENPTTLPMAEMRLFVEIFNQVKRSYVEEVDDKTLLENAIKGMLSELDPHSAYLKPDEYNDLKVSTTGKFGGLGIVVGMEDGYVKVISPIDDTPADKAGIKAGDLIVKLDDKMVSGMTLNEAVDLMRGEPNTKILLTILRDGVNKPMEISITRDIIKVESVKQKTLEPGYGYLRISNFQVQTGSDLRKAYKEILKENSKLDGLVLDLRNNPGGVLDASVEVSELFMDGGDVVSIKGRDESTEKRFTAKAGDETNGVPIVVLVNAGSASASEIVAGALQDHKRAIIMGTTTFGKGSVQTVIGINDDHALKLTTALYYTPSGRSIQAEGIKPDIVVEMATLTPLNAGSDFYKESDLNGHLDNGNVKKELTTQEKLKDEFKGKDSEKEKPLAETDFQLYQALTLLKSLKIVNSLNQAKP